MPFRSVVRTHIADPFRLACLAVLIAATAWVPGAVAQAEDAPATSAASPPEGSVGGMGDINLYPKRIVLQDRQRIATLGLYNRAPAEGNYEIKLNDKMMMPDGRLLGIEDVEDEAYRARLKSAVDLLRWSPRKIVLPPSEAQTVRIMARIPPELPPGEYRTHLSVTQVPASTPGGFSIEAASGQARPNTIGVTIVPRFGIAIPVIVRVGETTLQTQLRDMAMTSLGDGRQAVSLVIMRSGNRSAFGDLKVTVAGSNKPIGVLKGIGVYPEIDQRPVRIPLDPETPASAYARGSKLTVTYTDDDYRVGQVLASQDFTVP